MRSELPPNRLNPDEVGEVLRRSGVEGARFAGRPTVEEVAERAGMTPDEVLAIVRRLRSLGAAIDAPSGDLEAIREQAQDLEELEEDPRALARISTEYAGVEVESGDGRKLPKATRLVLILAAVIFFGLVLAMVTRTPPPPTLNP